MRFSALVRRDRIHAVRACLDPMTPNSPERSVSRICRPVRRIRVDRNAIDDLGDLLKIRSFTLAFSGIVVDLNILSGLYMESPTLMA